MKFKDQTTLVDLSTPDRLKRVLFAQKTVAQQVHREMLSLATTEELATGKLSGPEEATRIIRGQRALLEKYSSYPSLSQFSTQPSLIGVSKWGATFGVAILVRSLIIDQVKAALPKLAPFVRLTYSVILNELHLPTHENLVEPLSEVLKFKVSTKDGQELDEDKSKTVSIGIIYKLAESLIAISIQYGIIEGGPHGFAITDMGRNVLMHLHDSETFVEELVEAHKIFQDRKAEFSCV